MTEAIQIAQRILNDQGFMVIRSQEEYVDGQVIEQMFLTSAYWDRIPGPIVILGEATQDQWLAQHRRYRSAEGHCRLGPEWKFYRAVAE